LTFFLAAVASLMIATLVSEDHLLYWAEVVTKDEMDYLDCYS
jgi:hypothetical protein